MRRRRLKFSDYYHNVITEELAKIYNIKKGEIFLGSRKKNIIFAKRMYIYILREMFGLTLNEIGRVTISQNDIIKLNESINPTKITENGKSYLELINRCDT